MATTMNPQLASSKLPLDPKFGSDGGTAVPGSIGSGAPQVPTHPVVGQPEVGGNIGAAPSPPPGSQTPLPPGVTDRESATNVFRSLLGSWGFNDADSAALTEWAWQQILNGAGEDEVENNLYQHEIFKREFPEYEARRQAGMPISVQDILNYRQTVSDAMHYFDIAQFYDGNAVKDLTRTLITNNVSGAEATDRIANAFSEIDKSPAEAHAIFGEWYGPTSRQALAAYFLAPDHALPTLERQVRMAEISGAGRRFGINVNQMRAEDLERYGISESQAQQGFNQLDQISPLFEETISEGTDYTKEGIGIDATFGVAPGAQTQLQRRLDERRAALAGSGGSFVTDSGVRGL